MPCGFAFITCWGMVYTAITAVLSAHEGYWVGFWLCTGAVVALSVFFKTFAQVTISIYLEHWRRKDD